jgi:acetyl esterase/lipase
MARSICVVSVTGLLLVCTAARSYADSGYLRTIQNLDEPRGYCLDIRGEGTSIQLDQPLQAHTCKYGGPVEDQRFERSADGAILAPAYNRCLAAASLADGAQLLVRPCAAADTQRWSMAWGRLSPVSRSDLCVTVAGDKGRPFGTPVLISPVYHQRDLVLDRCDAAREGNQSFRWSLPEERGVSSAEITRQGMPADIATQLMALRTAPDTNAQTYKVYASQPRVYEASEIKVVKNIAYGPHERQQIDVHTGTMRRATRPVPVVAVFHGGGLIGGSRANTTTVADYFASIGFVGVNAGYRLAPDSKWPDGARDVAAVVTWLHAHAAEYNGDPDQIFLIGISTGSLHTGTYVFRPELLPPGTPRVAGAILCSGPFTFDFSEPMKGELAYFGEDKSKWPQMVVTGNVTRADIPVLLTTAEWDEDRYYGPVAQLYGELVQKHHVKPRYRQSLGHNHVSQLLSMGTVDTSVSREILDFIDRVIGR